MPQQSDRLNQVRTALERDRRLRQVRASLEADRTARTTAAQAPLVPALPRTAALDTMFAMAHAPQPPPRPAAPPDAPTAL